MPRVKFVLEYPGAKRVYVAGDFNDWNPEAKRMRRAPRGRDIFVTFLELDPGLHQFKYVVDGEWVCDPRCPKAKNEEGVENSVMEVLEPGRRRRMSRAKLRAMR